MTALITREDLKAEIDAGKVTVVDCLGGEYYQARHLPGAVAIRPGEVRDLAPELLTDKTQQIVTYCSNEACPNSEQVAQALTGMGYTNVRKYKEGIQDWTEAGLPVESA